MHEIKTLSPKQFADAIGVSESSIRRWVDDGLIDVMRTAGGHRRILLVEALRFVRSQAMQILRPELLELPELTQLPPATRHHALTGDLLFQLLLQGDEVQARGLIVRGYLSGKGLGELFDGPIAEALAQVGALWEQSDDGIFQEHHASQICQAAVHQIRSIIPTPSSSAPRALGGAPTGDPSLLPSLMAGTLAASQGYQDIILGPETPGGALLAAVDEHKPDVVWLSLTAHLTKTHFDAVLRETVSPLSRQGVTVVVGGQAAILWGERWPSGVHVMSSMQAFEAYLKARYAGGG